MTTWLAVPPNLASSLSLRCFPACLQRLRYLASPPARPRKIYYSLLEYLSFVIPHDAMGTVLETFNQTTAAATSGKLTFGLVAAVWSASVGFSAIQDSLNVVYKVKETRSYFAARLSAIGVTILLMGLVTLILASLLGADFFARLAYLHIYHHFLAALVALVVRSLGMAVCRNAAVALFCRDLLLRAGCQTESVALDYARRGYWHRGMAHRFAWTSTLCSLLQQLLGHVWVFRRSNHPA